MSDDRALPHNLDAERAVLGALMVDHEAYTTVAALIAESDIYRDAHRRIYRAMGRIHRRGAAIDLVTARAELDRTGDLDDVGGPAYMASLIDGVPRATNVEHYARIIKEKSTLRSVILETRKTLQLAYDEAVPATDLIAATRANLLAVAEPRASEAARSPVITYLDTVAAEAVDWVWPARIARGKYTLVAGEPGVGKTHLMCDLSARITARGRWPDGSPAPMGRVLWLTAEDGLADTLRPRIESAGGDVAQVAVLEAVQESDGSRSGISLVRDLQILDATIAAVQPVVVITDPITAYLGQVDTHRDAEVRAALSPVLDRIAQHRCAWVAIGHLTKDNQRAALHRPGGSIAFVAAARIVLAVAADPQNPQRRLLAPLKSNISRSAPTLAYQISASRLEWETGAVADADVEAMFRGSSPGERQERVDAEAVLAELLATVSTWPIDASEALAAGHAHGIHERTLQRAARRMGFRIGRQGFGRGGRWVWDRPIPIPDIVGDTSPRTLPVSSMSSMTPPAQNHTKNNIDDTDTAFPRARARTAGKDHDAERI
ncbi:MAG: DnaB-like helicase N-terminal domain-containing protein [Vicinamibacterales bacterium]